MDLSIKPVPKDNVEEEELEGEILVYNPETGEVHNLNGTASFLWKISNGDRSVEEMIDIIAEEAEGVDRETIEQDVIDFVKKMQEGELFRISDN